MGGHHDGVPETLAETPLLTDRFDRAVALALEHHRRQLRKGTSVPYASHLLAVTAIVLELGGGEDEAIAGVLHDAVEDGGGPAMQARIEAQFGPRVATFVAENSDTDEDPKPPWLERKRAYLAHIPAKDPGAILVSLADKLHNARAIRADLIAHGDAVWTRFNAPRALVAGYYVALARRFADERHRLPYDGPAGEAAVVELGEIARQMCAAAGTDPEDAAQELLRAPGARG